LQIIRYDNFTIHLSYLIDCKLQTQKLVIFPNVYLLVERRIIYQKYIKFAYNGDAVSFTSRILMFVQ
jgi:hypothetical protein